MAKKFESASAISKGLGNALETIAEVGSLPAIRGQWYFVDPTSGANTSDGRSMETAVASLETAYAKALDGDGIAVISYGATSAATTSYLKKTIAWAKNGITVVGIASPVGIFGRARVSNLEVTTPANETISHAAHAINRETGSFITDGWIVGMTGVTVDSGTNNGATFTITAVSALSLTISETFNVQAKAAVGSCVMTSYISDLIDVQGDNNRFFNIQVANFSSHALSLGGLKVTGNRNYFENCHFIGAGHATPGAVTTARNILLDTAEEAVFKSCVIGTDTVLKAAANGEVRVDGDCKRIRFIDCEGLCYSATAGKGFLQSVDATAWSGVILFERCRFSMWNENGMGTGDDGDSWFIGTAPTSGLVWLNSSAELGWAAWDAVAGNDRVYVSNGAVHAATGGIALLTS